MTVVDVLLHEAVYVLIGIFAGVMAGALGVGGGIIVVPGLVFVFQMTQAIPINLSMHVAVGTSLAVMIFTMQASLRAHYKLGEILWSVYNKLWPGVVLGACVGSSVAELISTYWLKIIFAIFLLFVALKMLTDLHKTHSGKFPSPWINRLISFLIGLKSGLLGVGGGVLIIPYLTYCGVPARKIASVSNLCGFTIALVGTVIFMITGQEEMAGVSYATGYIYWPAVLGVAIPSSIFAPFGAKLNYVLPVHYLKYGFIVILTLTAIKMLF